MKKSSSNFIPTDNWAIRRRWMKVILAWAMLNVQYILVWGEDNALNQNIAITLIGMVIAITGSYVFGAAWDDKQKRRYASRSPEEGEGE